MLRASLLVLYLALASAARGQSLVQLDEGFDEGLAGWTATGLWHHAPAGQCGAPTGMAAYNFAPAACDCGSSGANSGLLRSPTFTLVNPPFSFSFDFGLSMDPDDAASLRLVRVADGAVYPLGSLNVNAALPTHATAVFSDPSWVGSPAYLEFEFQANGTGDVGFGWMLDNVEVRSGSWFDLGAGKPGSLGTPLLIGSGPLNSAFNTQLSLFQAHPNSTAILVGGLSLLGAPFKGGTLVPFPEVLVVRTTNAVGVNHLAFVFPAAAPPDLALYLQYWVSDPTASSGWSASNALLGLSQ